MSKKIFGILFLLFLSLAAFSQEDNCGNLTDDDGDGLVDCADGDCQFAANIEKGCNCNDAADNDGDGVSDILDSDCASFYGLTFIGAGSSDCSLDPPDSLGTFDFVGPPGLSGQNTVDTQSKMAIADLNGDGIPEVIATSKWNKSVRVIATQSYDGFDPGEIIDEFGTTGGDDIFDKGAWVYELELTVGDIDGDGMAEIFVLASERKTPNDPPTRYSFVALTFNAATNEMEPMYDAVYISDEKPGMMALADFDGDGKAELFVKNMIFAAETGALLAQGAETDWVDVVNSAPVAVDILPGGNMELVCGGLIYSVPDFTDRDPASPATLTVAESLNALGQEQYYPKALFDATEYGDINYSSASVADMNGDGNIDVVLTGATGSSNGNTAIFFWDVANDQVSVFEPPDDTYASGWPWGTGRPNLADLDGDGDMDINFIAGNKLWALTLDAGGNLVPLWATPRTINDSKSGIVSTTVYDFDNDGQPELVYRDSQQLVIVDGATGQDVQWASPCQSHTTTEGPIIADANGDGGTDLVIPCNFSNSFNINGDIQQQALGEIRMFYSSANNWLPTRKVYNQSGYFVVNINDDISIPTEQIGQTLTFGTGPCPNGVPGPIQPFNTFLNQVPTIGDDGCPYFPTPDVSFVGDNPNAQPGDPDYVDPNDPNYFPAVDVIPPICGDLGIDVLFNIINDGSLVLTTTIPVSFWDGDPTDTISGDTATLLHTESLFLNNFEIGDTASFSGITFNSTGKAFRLYIVLNDDGSTNPVTLNSGTILECDITNNIYYFDIIPDPFEVYIEKLSDNYKCVDSAADNGELRAVIIKNGVEVLDYTNFAFQWYDGPDTTTQIPLPPGANQITGLAEGDYTLVVRNTQKGCASVPVDTSIVRIGVDPEITIVQNSPQTQCNPVNGELEAFVTGGNTGFVFTWFDRFLNPLGIVGSVAGNLAAGEYIVSVDKDGCTKTASYTLQGPVFPVVLPQTIQNVVDCLDPATGVVTGTAYLSGVAQDSMNYTFKWYEADYDSASGLITRGTILASSHGSGPTRHTLLPGYYGVIVLDVATGCESDPPSYTLVQSQVLYPDVVTSILEPQTSCDPANPNGKLIADVYFNGVLQDPADFTFEWFNADNTLPGNLMTTVSGVNGQVAEGVANTSLPYTVRVTTDNNCSSTAVDTTMNEILIYPVVTGTTTDNSVCDPALAGTAYNGEVVTSPSYNGSPITDYTDFTVVWYDGDDLTDPVLPNTSPNGDILSGLDAGRYTISITRDSTACPSIPVTFEIYDTLILPAITLAEVGATNCIGGNPNGSLTASVDLGGTPTLTGYDFTWFENTDTSPTGTQVATVSGAANETANQLYPDSTYTVYVFNLTTGCSNTRSEIVDNNSYQPAFTLAQTPNSICDPANAGVNYNGTITGTVSYQGAPVTSFAGYGFKIFSGLDTLGAVITPPLDTLAPADYIYSELDSGYYTTYTYIASLGCYSDPVNIYVQKDFIYPVITLIEKGATNCDPSLPNGELTALGDGTTSGKIFKWVQGINVNAAEFGNVSPGVERNIASQLSAGTTYTIKVTNQSTGCYLTESRIVSDSSALPVITLTQSPNTICDPLVAGMAYNGSISAYTTIDSIPVSDFSLYAFKIFTGTDTSAINQITPPLDITAPPDFEFSELDSGYYTVRTYIPSTGCFSDPVSIKVLENFVYPVITMDEQKATNCDPSVPNGVLTALGDGTTAGRIFKWVEGTDLTDPTWGDVGPVGVENQATLLTAGDTYTVKVTTQATGCFETQSRIVGDSSEVPVIVLNQTPNTICDPVYATVPYDGTVTVNTSFHLTPVSDFSLYTFKIFSGSDTAAINEIVPPFDDTTPPDYTYLELDSGNYTLRTYIHSLGCYGDPVTIKVQNGRLYPSIVIEDEPYSSCDLSQPNGRMQAYVFDGTSNVTAGYDFIWFDGNSTADPVVGTVGGPGEIITLAGDKNYTVEATAQATGCPNTSSAYLSVNIAQITISSLDITHITDCITGGSIQANVDSAGIAVMDYTNLVFTWYRGLGTTVPPSVLLTETGRLLNDEGGANLYSDNYTVFAENVYTHCKSDTVNGYINPPPPLFTIDSEINYFPTDCSLNEGAATAWVDNGGIADFNYNFYWFEGKNINGGSNFYTIPSVEFDNGGLNDSLAINSSAGAGLTFIIGNGPQVERNSNEGPTIYELGDGAYSVVVQDRNTGCMEYLEIDLPSIVSPPAVIASKVNSSLCPYTIGDGQVDVEIAYDTLFKYGYINQQYEFYLLEGITSDLSSPLAVSLGANNNYDSIRLSSLLVPGMEPGYYSVVAVEKISGNDCPSVPVTVFIDSLARPPVIELASALQYNTSCDSSMVNGVIDLDIQKDTDDATPVSSYDIEWTFTPLLVPGPADMFGQPAGNYIYNGLNLGVYTVTVTDVNSTCSNVRSFTLYNDPPVILADTNTMIVIDKFACNPSGSIEITNIEVEGNPEALTNFIYEWFDGAANLGTSTAIGGSATTEVLDSISYPTIHAGDYYVIFTRNPLIPGTTGLGCSSAPLRRDIADQSVNPTLALSQVANQSCDPATVANGEINIIVTPGSLSTGVFDYAWDPIAINPDDRAGATANETWTALGPGTYDVDVRDVISGCLANGIITINDNPVIPTLLEPDTTIVPQAVCYADGSIVINDITPGTPGEYTFRWFIGDANLNASDSVQGWTSNYMDNTVATDPSNPFIGAGTYYFTAQKTDPTNPVGYGCITPPYKAVIDDIHVDPVLAISQTANQTCDLAFANGTISIIALTGGVSASSYDFEWTAFPSSTPGDRLAALNNQTFTNIIPGSYGFRITDNDNLCPMTGSVTVQDNPAIPYVQNADVIVNPLVVCGPGGDITVNNINVNGAPETVANYDFVWFNGDQNLNNTVDMGIVDPFLDISNFPTIGAGTYYFVVTRSAGTPTPGEGCTSAPYRADILDEHIPPMLAITKTANENCDLSYANGSITAVATTDGAAGLSYSFTLTSPTLAAPWDSLNIANTVLFGGLQPGSFNLTVFDDNTNCPGYATISIDDRPAYIDIQDVFYTIIDQFICAPDGSINVDDIRENSMSQPLANYSAQWYVSEADLNADNFLASTAQTYLDSSNYAGMGAGTYYFKIVQTTASMAAGEGCASAPLRADLEDESSLPLVTFALTSNSSCNANSNGAVQAIAEEFDGTNTDTYSFVWSYNGGALPAGVIQTDSANTSTLTNARDGLFMLTATNTSRTQCVLDINTSLDLDTLLSLPNIISVFPVDPIFCYPTGSLEVTAIEVGGVPAPVTDFDYAWYDDLYESANIVRDSTGTPVTSFLLTDQYPGTYFVIAQNIATDCFSQPKEIEISTGNIVYPVVTVQELSPQTSCDPFRPNASLLSTVDGGNDDTNPNYTFTWYDGFDGVGTPIGSTSTIYGLDTGIYSVSVFNMATGCATVEYFITEDAVERYRPQVSVASSPKINCLVDDGMLTAQVLNVPGNFRFDWYIGLVVDGTPDFTGNPQNGLPAGIYSVTATDIDSSYCTSDQATISIDDNREYPNIIFREDNPLTNCYITQPNAQFSATVDGIIGGYTIEWFNGTDTTGAADFIGSVYRQLSAGIYTVVITNDVTGCASSLTEDVTNAQVIPPTADPEILKHLESCLGPDGILTATVDGNTQDYFFEWSNGSLAKDPSDFTGYTYFDLDAGPYTVTARDIITGCLSEPVTVEIGDSIEYSEFTFRVKPERCEQFDGSLELEFRNNLPTSSVIWTDPGTGAYIDEGTALYDYEAGIYEVTVTTVFGCVTTQQSEIPTEIFEFNGVSPNGDNRNDGFEIACITKFPNNHVKIYNRAGQLVYQAENYDNELTIFKGIGERGIYFTGKELPDGTYFYVIDKGDGSEPVVGYLELFR